jgi:sarcosine oxidase subunit beta
MLDGTPSISLDAFGIDRFERGAASSSSAASSASAAHLVTQ